MFADESVSEAEIALQTTFYQWLCEDHEMSWVQKQYCERILLPFLLVNILTGYFTILLISQPLT